MGPIGSLETSVRNRSVLRNNPEDGRILFELCKHSCQCFVCYLNGQNVGCVCVCACARACVYGGGACGAGPHAPNCQFLHVEIKVTLIILCHTQTQVHATRKQALRHLLITDVWDCPVLCDGCFAICLINWFFFRFLFEAIKYLILLFLYFIFCVSTANIWYLFNVLDTLQHLKLICL
jgi:hypothetical protein